MHCLCPWTPHPIEPHPIELRDAEPADPIELMELQPPAGEGRRVNIIDHDIPPPSIRDVAIRCFNNAATAAQFGGSTGFVVSLATTLDVPSALITGAGTGLGAFVVVGSLNLASFGLWLIYRSCRAT